jgi:hypothetical protein
MKSFHKKKRFFGQISEILQEVKNQVLAISHEELERYFYGKLKLSDF